MSADGPALPPSPKEMLAELWALQLKQCIAALKEDKPSASTLTAVRQFLADSNVNLDTLPQLKRTRAIFPPGIGPLPTFPDDEPPAPPTEAAASMRFVDLEAADDPDR
jgi:hypothetical protein